MVTKHGYLTDLNSCDLKTSSELSAAEQYVLLNEILFHKDGIPASPYGSAEPASLHWPLNAGFVDQADYVFGLIRRLLSFLILVSSFLII